MNQLLKNICFATLFLVGNSANTTKAQNIKNIIFPKEEKGKHIYKGKDTTYIKDYPKVIVGRIYAQNVMNSSVMIGQNGHQNLKYEANKGHVYGIGLGYRFLSVNFGLTSSGDNDNSKGKTKSFEFQSNLYYRKWVFDILFRNLKGMYLNDKGITNTSNYYVDPSMRVILGGANAWRILNSQKFSYKSVMTQSEWQQKSSGSFLLGGEAYYGGSSTNHEFVPDEVQNHDDYLQNKYQINSIKFFKIGPGIGYAYNFVFLKNWFVSVAGTINEDAIYTYERGIDLSNDISDKRRFGFQTNYGFRLGAGYNSTRSNINLQYLGSNSAMRGGLSTARYRQFAGIFKLTYNYRFRIGHKLQKRLAPVDSKLDYIDDKTKEIMQGSKSKNK